MKVHYRFAFVPGAGEEGGILVSPDASYDMAVGWGFAVAPAAPKYDDLRDSWPGEYFEPVVPSFLLDVPNGNYRIRVKLGDADSSAETTVKFGIGRVMLKGVRTEPGQFVEAAFAVHVDDGQLKLAFGGAAPAVRMVEIERDACIRTLFMAGDSTMSDQPSGSFPYHGWGQALPAFLKADVAVSNHARSGRSSKSFIDEDRLNRIWKRIRPGDLLLVQFAHNDEKDNAGGTQAFTTFKEYLTAYVEGARARGAHPSLTSAMHRRFFDEEGRIKDTHGDYITAVQQLAEELKVPYIDLAARSKAFYESLGDEPSKEMFIWVEPNRYPGIPEGAQDNTHFSEKGAYEIARLVVEEIREVEIAPLQSYLRGGAL
jgi:lysophospholipase L1-like esterase